jgi:DNA-3-methyladenine glycosylase I
LRKREHYREVLDGFDPEKIARYTSRKLNALMADSGVVRNRLKIDSLSRNARAFLDIQEEYGSFDAFVWPFVGGKPKVNARKSMKEVPARTEESDTLSKALKKRGFTFVGTTICYAFMQAVGLVNDHEVSCFRYGELVDRSRPGVARRAPSSRAG